MSSQARDSTSPILMPVPRSTSTIRRRSPGRPTTRLMNVVSASPGVGAAERHHVDVLTGHAAHHVGSGDEDPALRRHDDDIGESRAVGGAAGRKADDD